MDEGQSDPEKRNLLIVLSVLVVLMVGLIVAIIIIKATAKNPQEQEEETTAIEDDTEQIDCSDIAKLNDNYSISTCLDNMYREGKKDEAINLYEEKITGAFNSNNYELASALIISRAYLYTEDNNCTEAINSLEDDRIATGINEDKAFFYNEAAGVSIECNNQEKKEYFSELSRQNIEDGVGYGE